jgi:hypothetical protein
MGAEKRAGGLKTCLPVKKTDIADLDVGLGLAKAGDALAFLPLAALLENGDAFEAFEDVALHDDTGGALEAFVL